MLSRIKTSLIKLYGRFKKMVGDLLLQFGAVCIPLGVLIAMFAFQFFEGWAKYICICIGVIITFLGILAFRETFKLAKAEIAELTEKEKTRMRERLEDNSKFAILINEMRAMREDLKNGGKKDGESKPTTQTPDSNLGGSNNDSHQKST